MHAAAARTTDLARVLNAVVDRKARQPKAGRDDWVVYGCVLDQERNAVAGARVRVFDKDLLLRDVLGLTGTDEHGDFFIVYRKGDLADVWAKKPDLRVRVETDKGRVLYVSEQSIHFIAGHAEYFEIVLDRPGPTALNSNRDAVSAKAPKEAPPGSTAPIASSADQPVGTSRSVGTKASVVTKKPSTTPAKAPARATPRRATRRK
jgi:hypothetical protein